MVYSERALKDEHFAHVRTFLMKISWPPFYLQNTTFFSHSGEISTARMIFRSTLTLNISANLCANCEKNGIFVKSVKRRTFCTCPHISCEIILAAILLEKTRPFFSHSGKMSTARMIFRPTLRLNICANFYANCENNGIFGKSVKIRIFCTYPHISCKIILATILLAKKKRFVF